jgi:hypothetical protein
MVIFGSKNNHILTVVEFTFVGQWIAARLFRHGVTGIRRVIIAPSN